MDDLYDTDIALWAERQASALRRRSGDEIDWDNVAEEIESSSRSDKREIRNRLAMICAHLLKWQFQPEARSSSRRGCVREARKQIAMLIDESPSLASYPAQHLHGPKGACANGRGDAAEDTGVADLPAQCPWTIAEVLDRNFWPN